MINSLDLEKLWQVKHIIMTCQMFDVKPQYSSRWHPAAADDAGRPR